MQANPPLCTETGAVSTQKWHTQAIWGIAAKTGGDKQEVNKMIIRGEDGEEGKAQTNPHKEPTNNPHITHRPSFYHYHYHQVQAIIIRKTQ